MFKVQNLKQKSISIVFVLISATSLNCSKLQSFEILKTPQAESAFSAVSAIKLTYSSSMPVLIENRQYSPSVDATNDTALDLIYDRNNVRPLIVFVHGGGWTDGDKEGFVATIGKTFFDQGYAFSAINYRKLEVNPDFSPKKNPIVGIPSDIARALSYLQRNAGEFNLNFNKTVLIGHSAGAHLAALTLANPSYLQAVGLPRSSVIGLIMLDSPVTSFPEIIPIRPVLGKFVGSDLDEASPVFHVQKSINLDMPPVYQIYGPNSEVHPAPVNSSDQAQIFRRALLEKGARVVWSTQYNIPHGEFATRLYDESSNVSKSVIDFLDRILGANRLELINSSIFDWQAYLALNPGLINFGIGSETRAQQHWMNSGLAAGRQGNAQFSAVEYLRLNPQVEDKYGNDYVAAAHHYLKVGRQLGLVATPEQQAFGGQLPDSSGSFSGDAVLGNQFLKIVTSSKYAGAIEQLWYKDSQLVDDGARAYGRLFQMAAWKNGLGKCFNPIEAGSRYNDSSSFRSPILNSVSASAQGLATSAVPALFRRLNEDGCSAGSLAPQFPFLSLSELQSYLPAQGQVRDNSIRFEKNIVLSTENPNMFLFHGAIVNDALIDVSQSAQVVPFIVQLYAALKTDFSTIYTLDFRAGQCTSEKSISSPECQFRTRPEGYSPSKPAILVRADGLAFGMYSTVNSIPKQSGVTSTPAVYQAKAHLGGSDGDVMDTAVNFSARDALPAGRFGFSVNVFVGPKEQVRRDLIQLVRSQP